MRPGDVKRGPGGGLDATWTGSGYDLNGAWTRSGRGLVADWGAFAGP